MFVWNLYLVQFDAVVVRFLFNKQEQNYKGLSIVTTLDSKTATEIDMTARCRKKKNQKKVRIQLRKVYHCYVKSNHVSHYAYVTLAKSCDCLYLAYNYLNTSTVRSNVQIPLNL